MTYAGSETEKHGNSPSFGDLEGQQRKVVSFLGVRRLEHWHPRRYGVAAVILFVLARCHTGIVSRNHQQCATYAGVGGREQGIGSHVQANVFHGDQGSRIGKADPEPHFQSDLLIRRPLCTASQLGKGLQNLRGGRARIPRAQGDASVARRQSHGLVSTQ